MSIYSMTRAALIEKVERDDAAVKRAAGVLRDNADMQSRLIAAREEIERLRSATPKADKNAQAEISVLQKALADEKVKGVSLASEKAKAEANSADLKLEATGLRQKVNDLKSQVEAEKARTRDVEFDVQESRASVDRARDEIAALDREIFSLKAKLSQFDGVNMSDFRKWCDMVKVAKVSAP